MFGSVLTYLTVQICATLTTSIAGPGCAVVGWVLVGSSWMCTYISNRHDESWNCKCKTYFLLPDFKLWMVHGGDAAPFVWLGLCGIGTCLPQRSTRKHGLTSSPRSNLPTRKRNSVSPCGGRGLPRSSTPASASASSTLSPISWSALLTVGRTRTSKKRS
jgi:hypothetical protein